MFSAKITIEIEELHEKKPAIKQFVDNIKTSVKKRRKKPFCAGKVMLLIKMVKEIQQRKRNEWKEAQPLDFRRIDKRRCGGIIINYNHIRKNFG